MAGQRERVGAGGEAYHPCGFDRPVQTQKSAALTDRMMEGIEACFYSVQDPAQECCHLLHRTFGACTGVARRMGLDRRTVRKHVEGTPHGAD